MKHPLGNLNEPVSLPVAIKEWDEWEPWLGSGRAYGAYGAAAVAAPLSPFGTLGCSPADEPSDAESLNRPRVRGRERRRRRV